MRASFKEIEEGQHPPQIQLAFQEMTPIYVEHRQATKKYKKVGKEVRTKLLRCI